ncbi:MAG: beta-fructofuranosidase [Kribbellaceae bacterium]|nr:beta-fructofuranosidase [Kribbellaceae bacterium]
MSDHHLPRYHVRPPTGYVNDPNGPVFFGGRWHLFFQYVHDTPRRGPVVWGHASSADLARWQLHRPALSPHPEGPDRNGCWSGNTVAVGNELVAFYSGSRHGSPYQSVLSARSVDGGHSFGPPRQVVPDPSPSEGVAEFRDPFVWQENGTWSMLVGAGSIPDGPSARLYTSPDLETWEYQGPYAAMKPNTEAAVDVGDMWECPQLLSYGNRDALLVSSYGFHGGGPRQVLALSGSRVDGRLIADRIEQVDHGPNFYAASVLRDGALLWGWITEGRSADWANEADWSGLISLPRTASLTADGRLATTPVTSLTTLRESEIHPATHDRAAPASTSYEGLPAQFELETTLTRTTAPTTLSLQCSYDEHLDVTVDWDTGAVTIDRAHASRDPRAHRDSHTFTDPDITATGTLALRWFVDGSVSELFTASGYCATTRFYPITPPPWTLTLTDPGPTQLWSLTP